MTYPTGLKITADGQPFGVQVIDPATGANLAQYIRDIHITLRPGEPTYATLDVLVDIEVAVRGDHVTWQRSCICGGDCVIHRSEGEMATT